MAFPDRSFGEAIAEVARRLEAEGRRTADPGEDIPAAVVRSDPGRRALTAWRAGLS
jgi:hypothetical protein